MPTATVTSKGQITIPVKVRRALGIKPGTRVDFYHAANGRVEMRAKTGSIMDLAGCVPKLDHIVTIEEMNEGIAQAVAAEYLAGLTADRGNENSDGEAA